MNRTISLISTIRLETSTNSRDALNEMITKTVDRMALCGLRKFSSRPSARELSGLGPTSNTLKAFGSDYQGGILIPMLLPEARVFFFNPETNLTQLRNERTIQESWPNVLLNTFTRERYFQFSVFPLGTIFKRGYKQLILFLDIYSSLQTKIVGISQRIISIWKDGLIVSCFDGCEVFVQRLMKEARARLFPFLVTFV